MASLPSLPSLSGFLTQPATTSLPTSVVPPGGYSDASGHIYNSEGIYVGNLPSPLTAAPATSQSTASTPKTDTSPTVASSGTNYLQTLEQWAANLVDRNTQPSKDISLEDIVLIVLGVLLVGAALVAMVFTFNETQRLVKSATKTARGAADAAIVGAVA